MSPRRNRPPRPGRISRPGPAERNPDQLRRGIESVEVWGHGQWRVRQVPGSDAVKFYRCPGCDHEIRPGVSHVVVWPADELGDVADRRHWHTGCWRARDRRRPTR